MSDLSFNPAIADVVFVGGGPVALWTAIQTKLQNSHLNIVVLEKYADYKRIHNLFVESASLVNKCNSPLLDAFTKGITAHPIISTKVLENSLAELAEKVGIIFQRNVEIRDPEKDLAAFSNAKVIVGADGAHSVMRQHVVSEVAEKCFQEKTELHYIADLTYSETKEPVGLLQKTTMNSTVGNCIYEIHSKKSQKTTLRTFISPEVYEKMKQATRKNPENINSPVVDETVRQEYLTFLKAKYEEELEECIDLKKATVTTTTLGTYISKKFVKKDEKRTWCLVGDAAFGVPFFKSLNNGFLSGTRLAETIGASFKMEEDKTLSKMGADRSFEAYESHMQSFAKWQVRFAGFKSNGVNMWIGIAKMFHVFSSSRTYLKASYFED